VLWTTSFLMSFSAPVCWQTKILPSGATSIDVGLENPVNVVSVKPVGRVAPETPAATTHAANQNPHRLIILDSQEFLTPMCPACAGR